MLVLMSFPWQTIPREFVDNDDNADNPDNTSIAAGVPMTLPTGAEQFDVAFSFVDREDLAAAKELRDLLEPELSAFVYTDRQEIVGGGDGMTAYANVFKNDTRLTVVLLRPSWGKTDWTEDHLEVLKALTKEAGEIEATAVTSWASQRAAERADVRLAGKPALFGGTHLQWHAHQTTSRAPAA
ncbi:MAG: hypothetical protein JWL71_438 [Acidobacteria bacterium]|nr:hypothetical protein [Acidobacteriota bacterium]